MYYTNSDDNGDRAKVIQTSPLVPILNVMFEQMQTILCLVYVCVCTLVVKVVELNLFSFRMQMRVRALRPKPFWVETHADFAYTREVRDGRKWFEVSCDGLALVK